MELTANQLSLIKAEVNADPVLAPLMATGGADDANTVAVALNLTASPAFMVWQSAVPTQTVFDAILWANFTPQDAPDGTNAWLCRSLACQGKQFNVQILLSRQETLNAAKQGIRTGLQDALTTIPSGAGGANRSGGWTTVQAAMQRTATRGEKVLATGTGSVASPAILGFEGAITYQNILDARNS